MTSRLVRAGLVLAALVLIVPLAAGATGGSGKGEVRSCSIQPADPVRYGLGGQPAQLPGEVARVREVQGDHGPSGGSHAQGHRLPAGDR